MSLRLSTGLRNKLLETKSAAVALAVAQITISFSVADGPNGGDKISDSGNGLSGAKPGATITVFGSASNNGTWNILSTPGDGSYVEVEASSLTAAIAGASVTLMSATGGSFSDLFRNGVMRIFPGTQPANADTTEGVSHLVEISLASAAFAVGGVNGINFGDAASGILGKSSVETWSGVAIDTNTAGWFRMYDKDRVVGASTAAVRFDGAVAQAGAQLNMSNTAITNGGTTTIDSVALTLPTA
ncbi:MAG: hypothetical protein ABFS32_17160 [Bacteroidota bacterium]